MLKKLTLLVLLALLASAAAHADESSFTPAWIDGSGQIGQTELKSTLDGVAAQASAPDNIIVLVHGFLTSRDESARQYGEIAKRLQSEFKQRHQSVAVVGIQWDSAVKTGDMLLPPSAVKNYLLKVDMARKVGRYGSRQVLLGVKKRFPHAHVSILAHSLGCEVSAACLTPEMSYGEKNPVQYPIFQPKQPLAVMLWVAAGSDLDHDAWAKSKLSAATLCSRTGMVWRTMSKYVGDEDRDKVLQIREAARGEAGGSGFPLMTPAQCDALFKGRRLFFDDRDIPSSHELLAYYNKERLERVCQTIAYLDNPKNPEPAELSEVDKVLASPARLKALQPWLDSPNLSARLYALWRIEAIEDGDSKHMSDGTLDQVARMLRDKPQRIWHEQKKSPCKTIRERIYPTSQEMTAAGAPDWARNEH